MNNRALLVGLCAALFMSMPAGAQSANEWIAKGDQARAALRMAEALQSYEAAIASDAASYEALCKAANAAVILGEFDTGTHRRDSLYSAGERYARRAVADSPADAEGHFQLAQALGRISLTVPLTDRAKYAIEIRSEALAALAATPNHASALHVMGMWHQNVMQLSAWQRMIARLFLGAKTFIRASWAEALSLLEQAVAIEPNRIVHRLDLGHVYADQKQPDKAHAQFEWILAAPAVEYNDEHYKRQAGHARAKLKPRPAR